MSGPRSTNPKKGPKKVKEPVPDQFGEGLRNPPLNGVCPADRNYDPFKDEGLTQWTFRPTHPSVPRSSHLEEDISSIQEHQRLFESSELYTFINSTFSRRFFVSPLAIHKCIIFGLGSPITPHTDQQAVQHQLALFLSIIALLGRYLPNQQPPELIVQDPALTSLDHRLLSRLGIKPVQHPAALLAVDAQTLVYAPYAPGYIIRGFLARKPCLVLTPDALTRCRDPANGAVFARYHAYWPHDYAKDRRFGEQAKERRIMDDQMQAAVVIGGFLRGRERLEGPVYEPAFSGRHAFDPQARVVPLYLYWQVMGVEELMRSMEIEDRQRRRGGEEMRAKVKGKGKGK